MARLSSFVRVVVSGSVICAAACGTEANGGGDGDEGGGGSAPIGGASGAQPTGGASGAPTGGASGAVVTGGAGGQGGTGLGGAAGTTATGGAMSGAAGTSFGGLTGAGDGGSGPGGAGDAGGGAGGTAGSAVMGGQGGTGGTGGKGGAGAGGKGGAGGMGGGGKGGSGGSGGSSGCMTPPAASPLVGWASVNEMNQNGTTGGTGTPVVVTTTAAFNSNASGTAARVIHVSGNLSGNFSIGSNKTVIGVCGATLQGHVSISNAVNVILRNIKVVGNNCSDSPQDCSAGADAISITNNSHHVWVDHLDVSDGSDGNLDTNAGSDLVTISWTKFSYSSMRTDPMAGASGHRFSNLIGSGDNVTGDIGHLRVTLHHDWWAQNVNQRMPRTRFGNIHVFNNLYTSTGNSYCTNAGIQTHVLVENNAYIGVNNPLAPDANGDMLARGNLFQGTSGTTTANGTGFTPPYQFTLDATSNLQATIQAQAGPH